MDIRFKVYILEDILLELVRVENWCWSERNLMRARF